MKLVLTVGAPELLGRRPERPEQVELWRKACVEGAGTRAGDNESLRQARNEIKRLKRKVNRKDKALAESAALLVLSKKFQALWEDEDQ